MAEALTPKARQSLRFLQSKKPDLQSGQFVKQIGGSERIRLQGGEAENACIFWTTTQE
ncbi:hypothetical protein J6S35_03500 [Candidatus Saccharibacteria bacterium]|nr:hypothetical protein [Candidatus Saccharibacteria bacterium]